MADENTQAADSGAEEELTIVEVEKLPEPGTEKTGADEGDGDDQTGADTGPEGADDGDDDGDERLGTDEDGERDSEANRNRRKQRREAQKRARERLESDLAAERARADAMERRLAALEGHTTSTVQTNLTQARDQAIRDAAEAERIELEALKEGNTDDALMARRIHAAAVAKANDAAAQLGQIEQQRQAPQVDPQLVNHANEWTRANPWYKHGSDDAASRLAAELDTQLVREGSNPASREHWIKLTQRINEAVAAANGDDGEAPAKKTGRKAPPTGGSREHAPHSTRNEIYVTPERKQAMQEAGVWDDPVARKRYLKSYQDYDRGISR